MSQASKCLNTINANPNCQKSSFFPLLSLCSWVKFCHLVIRNDLGFDFGIYLTGISWCKPKVGYPLVAACEIFSSACKTRVHPSPDQFAWQHWKLPGFQPGLASDLKIKPFPRFDQTFSSCFLILEINEIGLIFTSINHKWLLELGEYIQSW